MGNREGYQYKLLIYITRFISRVGLQRVGGIQFTTPAAVAATCRDRCACSCCCVRARRARESINIDRHDSVENHPSYSRFRYFMGISDSDLYIHYIFPFLWNFTNELIFWMFFSYDKVSFVIFIFYIFFSYILFLFARILFWHHHQ